MSRYGRAGWYGRTTSLEVTHARVGWTPNAYDLALERLAAQADRTFASAAAARAGGDEPLGDANGQERARGPHGPESEVGNSAVSGAPVGRAHEAGATPANLDEPAEDSLADPVTQATEDGEASPMRSVFYELQQLGFVDQQTLLIQFGLLTDEDAHSAIFDVHMRAVVLLTEQDRLEEFGMAVRELLEPKERD